MQSVNFIPMRRREGRKLRARRNRWAVACAAYALALAVGCLGWRAFWADDARDFSHELTLARGEAEETTRAINQLRASLGDVRQVLAVNRTVAGQPDWALLLAMIADVRGEDVVLNRCALESPADALVDPKAAPAQKALFFRLGGYGRTQAAVSQFVLRLEQTGLFESVALIKTAREPFLSGEAVAFKLDCQMKAGAPAAPAAPRNATATVGGDRSEP